jgi:acyl-CoA reductase-like NAD-dependent aldehyde dehydrogenase
MAASPAALLSINPATEEEAGRFEVMPAAEVDTVLAEVSAGQPGWAGLPLDSRCDLLRRLAVVLSLDPPTRLRA